MTRVIGVMSGTSLDGIDICYVRFNDNGFKLINYTEVAYSSTIKMKIEKAISNNMDIGELTSLHYELGYEYSRAIKIALLKFAITNDEVDIIANHGQTIFHNDNKPEVIDSTLQLGCGDIIKSQLNTNVVTDFRAADISLGNKGAPLVQIFDKYLINIYNLESCGFLNIGGISNIYIDSIDKSFDTGPGNMMINYATKKLYNMDFDNDGLIADKGKVNIPMLNYLMSHDYFNQNTQLSTGREDFGDHYANEILLRFKSIPHCDIIATLTQFTANSIAHQILKYVDDIKQTIYVSGGGAYNTTLLKLLRNNFKNTSVLLIDELGIKANQKEAVAFAYFGYANYNNICLQSQNGKQTIYGVLHKKGNYE